MANAVLFTTGYEGEDIQQFTDKLIENNINLIIDVREIPISRKVGFSKSALKSFLKVNDINYLHYKELGSPKNIRHKLHDDKDYCSFFDKYREYIQTKEPILYELKETIVADNACLLCFEKDPKLCHRSILAEELNKKIFNKKLKIINI